MTAPPCIFLSSDSSDVLFQPPERRDEAAEKDKTPPRGNDEVVEKQRAPPRSVKERQDEIVARFLTEVSKDVS